MEKAYVRIRELSLLIIRYLFWFVIIEVWLHFIYSLALKEHYDLLENMDLWTLAGVSYSLGQFFMLKYVFFYGFPRPFMKADGIDPPDHPKCIGKVILWNII